MFARSSTLLLLALTGCSSTSSDADAMGGSGGGGGNGPAPVTNGPTWHADVAPLVRARCQGCHRPGAIAPFSLETYEQAKMWSSAFDGVVSTGLMPPFLARTTSECAPRFGFKDDLRLSEAERDLLKRWVEAGAPEGDPATAAPLPEPPLLELTDAEVDLKIPSPVTIQGPGDKFVCFSLAPDFSKLAATGPEASLLGNRVLIDAAQVHAGNAAIVHHVLVFTDSTGESATLAGDKGWYDCFGGPQVASPGLVMAWAPGALPIQAPQGVAVAIPSTGRLVLQVHYLTRPGRRRPTTRPPCSSAATRQASPSTSASCSS